MSKRDFTRYELWDGPKKVYIGITNDPERRIGEHDGDRKRFTRMEIVGSKVAKETALTWEQEALDAYRRGHKGRNPRHNKT